MTYQLPIYVLLTRSMPRQRNCVRQLATEQIQKLTPCCTRKKTVQVGQSSITPTSDTSSNKLDRSQVVFAGQSNCVNQLETEQVQKLTPFLAVQEKDQCKLGRVSQIQQVIQVEQVVSCFLKAA